MFHRTERLLLRPAWPEDWEMILWGIGDERVVRNLARAPWPYLANSHTMRGRIIGQREARQVSAREVARVDIQDG